MDNLTEVWEINAYSLGYSGAFRFVEEDIDQKELKNKDFYYSLSTKEEDPYDMGWLDAIDEMYDTGMILDKGDTCP